MTKSKNWRKLERTSTWAWSKCQLTYRIVEHPKYETYHKGIIWSASYRLPESDRDNTMFLSTTPTFFSTSWYWRVCGSQDVPGSDCKLERENEHLQGLPALQGVQSPFSVKQQQWKFKRLPAVPQQVQQRQQGQQYRAVQLLWQFGVHTCQPVLQVQDTRHHGRRRHQKTGPGVGTGIHPTSQGRRKSLKQGRIHVSYGSITA